MFIAPQWMEPLQKQELITFRSWWELEGNWADEPNRDRGGWSRVARTTLQGPDGSAKGVYIKRQNNHLCRTLLHPIRGETTFAREFKNIKRLSKHGIQSLDPVFFATRNEGKDQQAILVTEELHGYESLEEIQLRWLNDLVAIRKQHLPSFRRTSPRTRSGEEFSNSLNSLDPGYRIKSGTGPAGDDLISGKCAVMDGHDLGKHLEYKKLVIKKVAEVIYHLNDLRFQHGCLYPKHIFIRNSNDGHLDVRLIDMEKCSWRLSRHACMHRDLDTINRHSKAVTQADRLRFILAYFGAASLDHQGRSLWKWLAKRYKKKVARV